MPGGVADKHAWVWVKTRERRMASRTDRLRRRRAGQCMALKIGVPEFGQEVARVAEAAQ